MMVGSLEVSKNLESFETYHYSLFTSTTMVYSPNAGNLDDALLLFPIETKDGQLVSETFFFLQSNESRVDETHSDKCYFFLLLCFDYLHHCTL
jgi:hypothetical protein